MVDIQQQLASLAKRRGFFSPSYEIYGGVAGFYDYGPTGSLMKDRILDILKKAYLVQILPHVGFFFLS